MHDLSALKTVNGEGDLGVGANLARRRQTTQYNTVYNRESSSSTNRDFDGT